MARWNPPVDRVDANEHVGRRLFEEPMLAGAQGQPKFEGLDLRNFEERRDREFSLDRLGRSSCDVQVLRYLRPRAESAGGDLIPIRAFSGWAVLRARQLENPPIGVAHYGKFPVVPSPEAGEGLGENLYHAHILTPELDHYSVALHLRQLFAKYGSIKQSRRQTESAGPGPDDDTSSKSLSQRILESASKIFRRAL
jgi:hypothetical protein